MSHYNPTKVTIIILILIITLLSAHHYRMEQILDNKPTHTCDLEHVESLKCINLSDTGVSCYTKENYKGQRQCRTEIGWKEI